MGVKVELTMEKLIEEHTTTNNPKHQIKLTITGETDIVEMYWERIKVLLKGEK